MKDEEVVLYNTRSHLEMTLIPNGYLIDLIITANEVYDIMDACLEFFQLNRDATAATVKKAYRTFLKV